LHRLYLTHGALPVGDLAADHCALLRWTTDPLLPAPSISSKRGDFNTRAQGGELPKKVIRSCIGTNLVFGALYNR
jgi:hypothetical protein